MIGFLSGKVVSKIGNQILIKTPGGVGYLVHVSPVANFMGNEALDIFIYHVRREDKDELFGFADKKDREWVDTMLKVNGVGPKMAANIIYVLGWQKIAEAVERGEVETFKSIKGLGEKTAKKIVLELKGAQTDLAQLELGGKMSQTVADFSEALSSLGYKKSEIVGIVGKMKRDGIWNEDDLVQMVKFGLKYLGK